MVHGNEEFHGAVKKAVSGSNPDEAKERNGSWTWNVAGCDFRDRTGVQGGKNHLHCHTAFGKMIRILK